MKTARGNRFTIEPFQRPSVLASTSSLLSTTIIIPPPTEASALPPPSPQQQQLSSAQTGAAKRLTIFRYKQLRLSAAKIRAKAKKKMTGAAGGAKRLAKRSIVGTRVCAMGNDRLWYAGAITNVKPPPAHQRVADACAPLSPPNAAGVAIGGESKYTVRFDAKQDLSALGLGPQSRRLVREFYESELIGPGFQSVCNAVLQPGQRAYITHNGRESTAEVVRHDEAKDEVTVRLPAGQANEVSDVFIIAARSC